MNVMLQRHAAKYIYVIPEGLKELMSDISREVLRMQPQNLYLFIADYLEALLLTRENARVAARLVQSITEIAEATMEFLHNTGMERPQVDKLVSIIHETFKKRIKDYDVIPYEQQPEDVEEANIITDILHEADVGADMAEEAAKIIQNAYKKFKHRKDAEKQLLTGMIDWRVAARSAIRLYRQTGVTTEEASRAATLIKAAYKGYYTRRVIKKLTEEQKILNPELEIETISEGEEETFDADYKHLMGVDAKVVKIDYDTVIPHVDFGDAVDPESPAAVACFTMDKLLDNVMRKVGHPEECKFPIKESKVKVKKSKSPSKKSKASKTPSGKASKEKASTHSVGKASVTSAGTPGKESLSCSTKKASMSSTGQSSVHSSKSAKHSGKSGPVIIADTVSVHTAGEPDKYADVVSKSSMGKSSVIKKVSIHHTADKEAIGDDRRDSDESIHSERSAGSQKSGRSEKSVASHRSQRSVKSNASYRSQRSEKSNASYRSERSEKSVASYRSERSEKSVASKRTERSEKSVASQTSGRSDRSSMDSVTSERSEVSGKSGGSHITDRSSHMSKKSAKSGGSNKSGVSSAGDDDRLFI